jgi:hypothetical protein
MVPRAASLGKALILFRHHDPNRPKSITKPAAFALHELSRTRALKAFDCDLECGVGSVRHVAGSYLYDLGPVMLSQPRCQFSFNPFAVCNRDSRRQGRPPIWNAVVTDELFALEERAGVGAAEELSALGTAFDTEQSQSADQIVQIVLDSCQGRKQRVFRWIMRSYL